MKIIFKKETNLTSFLGSLIYRASEDSLDFEPHPGGGCSSILIDYINLEVTDEGNVLYVWGLCPRSIWLDTSKIPPKSIKAGMRAIFEKIPPGVSTRLNQNDIWPIFFNKKSGWIFIGKDIFSDGFEGVEFADNSIAILSQDGSLIGLWLRPKMIL